MEDGKRESAVSMLPIIPEDSDSGRTYTCRVLNPAAPAGRQISVTINVQRECPNFRFSLKTTRTVNASVYTVICKTHVILLHFLKVNSTRKLNQMKTKITHSCQ